MHTIKVLGAGFALLGLCLLLARAFGTAGFTAGAKYFIPLWLAAAATNMWIGVSRAGYSIAEEFPIFVVIFGVPAGIAFLVWKMWGRG